MARHARFYSSIAVTTIMLVAAPLHATTLDFRAISAASSSASASASASSGPNGTTTSASATASGPGASSSASASASNGTISSASSATSARTEPTTTDTTITFALDRGDYSFDPRRQTIGAWHESGYTVEFGGGGPVYEEFFDNIRLSSYYTSDSGCCEYSYKHLDITREDGQTFSFEGMEIGAAISDTWLIASFTPEGAAYPTLYEETRLVYDNLRLRGTRIDGTEVDVFASSFLDVTSHPDDPYSSMLQLGAPAMEALTDLTSLSVRSGVYNTDLDMYRASAPFVGAGSSLNGQLSSFMMQAYNECLLSRGELSDCAVAGVGTFDFGWDSNYLFNFSNATHIGDIMLSSSARAPAPVPLPAGGWLLIAAGGMLVGLRRRARARARVNA